jgi:S1-C subfamily serine protease
VMYTRWTGKQSLAGLGQLEVIFLGKNKAGEQRVILDDSRETMQGTYEQADKEVKLKFYKGELTYTGTIQGNQLTGSAKDTGSTWNFSLTVEAMRVPQDIVIRPNLTGTGSVVDRKQRLVLTTCRVVGDTDDVAVYFAEFDKGELVGKRDAYKRKKGIHGKVVLREERIDLALVKLDELPADAKVLAMSRTSARAGQQANVLSSPGVSRVMWVYSPAQVKQGSRDSWVTPDDLDEQEHTYEGIHVDAALLISPADSGGPLVNERAVMVGMAHSSHPVDSTLSVFIDVSEARALVEKYYKSLGEAYIPEPGPPQPPPRGRVMVGV